MKGDVVRGRVVEVRELGDEERGREYVARGKGVSLVRVDKVRGMRGCRQRG